MRTEILTIILLLAASRTIAQDVPREITTPNKVETRIGTHAFNAFVNTLQGVSVAAIQKSFLERVSKGDGS